MNFKEAVLNTYGAKSFVTVKTSLIRALHGDGTTAILLSRLLNKYEHLEERGDLQYGDMFFMTVQSIEEELGMNAYHQRTSLGILKELGLINIEYHQMPQKRFIKIYFDKVWELTSHYEKTLQKTVVANKADFYEAINNADTVEDMFKAKSNIPPYLIEIIYAYSQVYRKKTHSRFIWDSKQYGILKRFWSAKLAGGKKQFDFIHLKEFYEKEQDTGLLSFKKFVMGKPDSSRPLGLIDVAEDIGIPL
jgi:hypothetical protein